MTMPRPKSERDRVVALVRRECLKVTLAVTLVVALGALWFLSWFYENHCVCLWKECFDIIRNVKTSGVCWR
jgi:hypothetical protein